MHQPGYSRHSCLLQLLHFGNRFGCKKNCKLLECAHAEPVLWQAKSLHTAISDFTSVLVNVGHGTKGLFESGHPVPQ